MPYAPVQLVDGKIQWFSFPVGMSRNNVMGLMYEMGLEIATGGIGMFQDEKPSGVGDLVILQGGHEAASPTPPGDIESQMPYGAFTQGLREAGVPTTGTLGQLARSQYLPAQLGFTAGQVLGNVEPGTTATQFAAQGAGGFRESSAEAFQRLGQMAAGERKLPPGAGEAYALELLDPEFFGSAAQGPGGFRLPQSATDALNLARARGATRLSPLTVSRFGPSNARIAQRLEEAIYKAKQGGTDFQFIPFLQQQFGT
jgi:hypothetical protein